METMIHVYGDGSYKPMTDKELLEAAWNLSRATLTQGSSVKIAPSKGDIYA